jgi:uncharacterized SAM-binding protein YcdF (DUF218 family)
MAFDTDDESDDMRKPRRRRPLMRLLLFAALAYVAGFAIWALLLPSPRESDGVIADAIVALTGNGNRLAPAVQLLELGHGERLLISGVNKATSKTELKALLKGGDNFDCCADLGFDAADTRGNAAEAAQWAHGRQYKSLIVVTASYHMPRSLLEFAATMPDVTLIPFPIVADPPSEISWASLQRLNGEFAKFLASWVRLRLFALNTMPNA